MKVLIVDDEVIIREAISQVVPWEKYGYQILEPAASAEEAIHKIHQYAPEIVLTDIKMAGKSGLELASEIQQLQLPIEVIVLTGYDEFSYAQKAIREGVSDYLLKNSSPEEILEAVQKVKKRLEANGRKLRQDRTESQLTLSYTVNKLLNGEVTKVELHHLHDLLSPTDRTFYQIIIIDTLIDNSVLIECEQIWNRYLKGWWFQLNGQTFILTFRSDVYQDDYIINMAIQKLYPVLDYIFLMGIVVEKISDLPLSYEKAQVLLGYQNILKDRRMITSQDVQDRKGISKAEFIQKNENDFMKKINSGNATDLEKWMKQLVEKMIKDPHATPESIQLVIQSLYITMIRLIHRVAFSVGVEVDELPSLLPVHQWLTLPKEFLIPTFTRMLELYRQLVSSEGGFVEISIQYMEMNLGNAISLREVAQFVNVHPNYLSDMLRKRIGKSYMELITELRLKKAKELLVNTPAKIKSISEQVGYSDWKYFTSQFKKETGQTPSQYRAKKDAR
ncbi:response regulator transcription factor [Gracilibacillus suaedae]|uniref:response regulator transcription factor n=1 Tax=Gracilibacillus suaedae TaxID=2820273 RepID=UPI001ABE478D|nr:response regulator [Gracilibacillus suaedae]